MKLTMACVQQPSTSPDHQKSRKMLMLCDTVGTSTPQRTHTKGVDALTDHQEGDRAGAHADRSTPQQCGCVCTGC